MHVSTTHSTAIIIIRIIHTRLLYREHLTLLRCEFCATISADTKYNTQCCSALWWIFVISRLVHCLRLKHIYSKKLCFPPGLSRLFCSVRSVRKILRSILLAHLCYNRSCVCNGMHQARIGVYANAASRTPAPPFGWMHAHRPQYQWEYTDVSFQLSHTVVLTHPCRTYSTFIV